MIETDYSTSAFSDQPQGPVIIAKPGLDGCGRKLKIRYEFSQEIAESFFALFPDANFTINRFSVYSRLAKDHFVIHLPGVLTGGCVIGGREICVTFHKAPGMEMESDIEEFENRLEHGGLGEVYYECHVGSYGLMRLLED